MPVTRRTCRTGKIDRAASPPKGGSCGSVKTAPWINAMLSFCPMRRAVAAKHISSKMAASSRIRLSFMMIGLGDNFHLVVVPCKVAPCISPVRPHLDVDGWRSRYHAVFGKFASQVAQPLRHIESAFLDTDGDESALGATVRSLRQARHDAHPHAVWL